MLQAETAVIKVAIILQSTGCVIGPKERREARKHAAPESASHVRRAE
jgi:hypothetical protein